VAPQPNQRDQTKQDSIAATTGRAFSAFAERHYTVAEIAEMWNLSKDAVRRVFQNEPGVLVLGSRSRGRKRRYATLRVPLSVLERVHRQYELGY
jgi:hypothetical protein